MNPYIIILTEELNEDDFDRRLQFYKVESSDWKSPFFLNICFGKECTFCVAIEMIVVPRYFMRYRGLEFLVTTSWAHCSYKVL